MQIVWGHLRQEFIQVESRRKGWRDQQGPIPGAEIHLAVSTKAKLLGQATRNPHAQAVALL